jgi:hypothetical protein
VEGAGIFAVVFVVIIGEGRGDQLIDALIEVERGGQSGERRKGEG